MNEDRRSHKSHWHEGWFALTWLFILIVSALSYPVFLSQGMGYELSLISVVLLLIILTVVTVLLFAGLKTDEALRRHHVYDRVRKKANTGRESHKRRKHGKKDRKEG